jgi:hypothetical protein
MTECPRASSDPPDQQSQLKGLAAFLPIFADPDFSFGDWEPLMSHLNGLLSFPYFTCSTLAKRFFVATYDLGWVDLAFDWMEWSKTEEARRLLADHRLIASATPDQLRKLLTMIVRTDRYCEGSLESDYKSGLLTAITLRAHVLVAEFDA